MPLHAGSRVGPYEIVDLLGAGGMGEVYRARDSRLGREVALKTLPPELAMHPERLRRFEREARSASALNHPHIVVVHDVGRDSGVDYLVMELVDGETLASRLVRGPLPMARVVELGQQLASALEASHRKGIVHRDLKPGNVMLTRVGVKLLDFGLAAAVDPEEVDLASQAATVSGPLTREGAVLGTPHYMAPEQLRAQPVDARTDIFALGVLLYEAATGRKAFAGATRVDLAQAVLSSEPEPASAIRAEVPKAFDELLRHCLAKDPEDRYRSAHDVGLLLSGLESGAVHRGAERMPRVETGSTRGRVVAAFLLGLLGVGVGWLLPSGGQVTEQREILFEFMPPKGHEFVTSVEAVSAAPSPDGSRIAFIARSLSDGDQRIWLRSIGDLEPRPLSGTEGAGSLMWSPDGSELAFFTFRQLRRVGLDGGGSVSVCELAPGVSRAGSWGQRGIVFTSVQEQVIYLVAPDGGEPEVLLRSETEEGRPAWPTHLPDGSGLLYLLIEPDGKGTLMLWRQDQEPQAVAPLASKVGYASDGWLVFAREAVLLAQAFDVKAGRLSGSPRVLAPFVPYFMSTFWAEFAVSPSGTLVYQSSQIQRRLTWLDRSGHEVGTLSTPGFYLNVSLSPSAERLLFDRSQPSLGTYDVWSLDLERGIETRLTSSPLSEVFPLMLPDEETLIYSSAQGGAPAVVRRDPRTGAETHLVSSGGFEAGQDVSSDGRWLVFAIRQSGRGFKLWSLDLTSQEPARQLLEGEFGQWSASFSPGGAYLAFVSDESGSPEAYVMPLHSPAERVRISPSGAGRLRWSVDGSEIFVLTPDGEMLSFPVRLEPELRVGSPVRLFSAATPSAFREVGRTFWVDFDVTPDGQRFIAVVPIPRERPQQLTVALGPLSTPR